MQTGIGISRGVSAGNAAMVGVPDYLEYYADDPETAVGLAYVEGIRDGRAFFDRLRALTPRQPLVVLKGGATAGGQRAAASHTGALASDDRVFDGMCRQAGITRAATVEEAFEAAATFATQPLPKGPNVAVVTTAGGWGVVTADAITKSRDLQLVELPDDLRAAIDEKLPPRWSRNNPIDLAGGETRDTIPEVLELVAGHPAVDAIVYLGLGIQSNQAALMRDGRLLPGRRARADRRLPRAPGRAVRARRGRDLRRDRQADPHRDRARDRRARQPGAAHRPRDRAPLLLVVEPRGHRARAPAALRRLARAARPRVTQPTRRARRTDDTRAHRVDVRRRVVAAVLGVVAIVLVVLALRGAGRARRRRLDAAARDAAVVGAPDARRPSSAIVGVQRLQAGTRPGGQRRRTRASTSTRRRVGSPRRRSDGPLIPASTQKLLTATAALDVLGADFRYETKAVAPAAPRERDRRPPVARRLGRPGHHDARGRGPARREPAHQGRPDAPRSRRSPTRSSAAGVRSIPGGIEGDDSRYDGTPLPVGVARPLPDRPRDRPARRAHRQRRLHRARTGRAPRPTTPR